MEKEVIEKLFKLQELYPQVEALDIPELKYYDRESEELLDDKIAVFSQLLKGKQIGEIPKFYDILELLPKEGIWDI